MHEKKDIVDWSTPQARIRHLMAHMLGREAAGPHVLYDMPGHLEIADGTSWKNRGSTCSPPLIVSVHQGSLQRAAY